MTTETFDVFTYGSLMYAPVWRCIVRGEYASTTATIHGFRRLCVRDQTYPVLIVATGAPPMTGRLYYGVSAADVQRLDAFETDAYARVAVAVTVNDTAIAAQTYLGLHRSELVDVDWNPAEFERAGMQTFLATYVKAHIATDTAQPPR